MKEIPREKKVAKSKEELQDQSWDMGRFKKVRLNLFKEKFYVDLREFYYDKNGAPNPTKKGISFPISEIPALIKVLQEAAELADSVGALKS